MNIMRDMVIMDEDNEVQQDCKLEVQQDCKLEFSTEVQTGDETENELELSRYWNHARVRAAVTVTFRDFRRRVER